MTMSIQLCTRFAPALRILCSCHKPLEVMLCLSMLVSVSGCASSSGPEVLTVSAAQYPLAFDAAVAAAREEGFAPALRDRRAGIIESDPQPASTFLEPWHDDKASATQALENTLAYQRRRVRFEFHPVATGDRPTTELNDQTSAADLQIPAESDLAGAQAPDDLSQWTGDVSLRAWVYVERSSTPGLRRFAWTRRTTSTARLVVPEGDTGAAPATYWMPVARDQAFERRLLAHVQQALAEQD